VEEEKEEEGWSLQMDGWMAKSINGGAAAWEWIRFGDMRYCDVMILLFLLAAWLAGELLVREGG
jgi:hypothetical protein